MLKKRTFCFEGRKLVLLVLHCQKASSGSAVTSQLYGETAVPA